MVDYRRVKPLGDRIFAEVVPPRLSATLEVPETWGGSQVRVLSTNDDLVHPEQELLIDSDQAVVLAGGYDSGSVVVFPFDAVVAFLLDGQLIPTMLYVEVEEHDMGRSPLHQSDVKSCVFKRLDDESLVVAKHDAGLIITYMGERRRFLNEGDILAEIDEC